MNRKMLLIAALCAALLVVPGRAPLAASKEEIDARVTEAIAEFYKHTGAGRQLAQKAAGMLVFPNVIKAGIGIGGEYGEGALLIRRRTVGYYNTVSASIGFQLGVQARSVIIMFMTPEALDQFRATAGWKIGADASVAIITVGVGGSIDTNKITSPVIGFILDPKGLMYNLTLEGSKISRIDR